MLNSEPDPRLSPEEIASEARITDADVDRAMELIRAASPALYAMVLSPKAEKTAGK